MNADLSFLRIERMNAIDAAFDHALASVPAGSRYATASGAMAFWIDQPLWLPGMRAAEPSEAAASLTDATEAGEL